PQLWRGGNLEVNHAKVLTFGGAETDSPDNSLVLIFADSAAKRTSKAVEQFAISRERVTKVNSENALYSSASARPLPVLPSVERASAKGRIVNERNRTNILSVGYRVDDGGRYVPLESEFHSHRRAFAGRGVGRVGASRRPSPPSPPSSHVQS